MAYRRALSVPSTLLARRFSPISFTYISHHDRSTKSEELHSYGSKMETFSNQRRSLVSYAFRPTPYRPLTGNAMYMSLRRGISTSSGEATRGAASIFEVSIAATDSTYPVAAAQYLIDYVHTVTGLNWWASIAVATLLVRGAMVPFYIYVAKKTDVSLATASLATASKIVMMRNMEKLEPSQKVQIMRQMKANKITLDRDLAAEENLFEEIRKKHGFSHLMFVLSECSMTFSFLFAVMNMAEKVPSFKTGGALWFTDLSTPDFLYIFPISMTLLSLVRYKKVWETETEDVLFTKFTTGASAALWIPLTMFLPNAVFCFWIPSRASRIFFLEDPRVRKALSITER